LFARNEVAGKGKAKYTFDRGHIVKEREKTATKEGRLTLPRDKFLGKSGTRRGKSEREVFA